MMVKLNDHYFVAWLKVVKGYDIEVRDTKVYVSMTSIEYTNALEEYTNTHKPVLREIRKVVKSLAALTSKPN